MSFFAKVKAVFLLANYFGREFLQLRSCMSEAVFKVAKLAKIYKQRFPQNDYLCTCFDYLEFTSLFNSDSRG